MRAEDKERVLSLVCERVNGAIIGQNDIDDVAANRRVEATLGETIFLEIARVEREKKSFSQRRELAELLSKRRKLFKLSSWGQRAMLAEFVESFAREVLGNWNETVYRFATNVLPMGLSTLLNAMSPSQLVRSFPSLPGIDDRLVVDGDVELVRSLYDKGTLIFAPTHVSNLDSIIIGYGLYSNDFPPVTYGAGINLFTNPMVSFFMHNLGAYKVDRKKKCSLYKHVLKEYATVSMELGYPNLFFPGGTRSRSGAVEEKLKLGLLGCGLTAYIRNLQQKKAKSKMFIVPVNLSFQLVLEAENLVEDYLKEKGQSRSIITDDEFARPKRVLDFIRNLFELDARIYMTFGPALDPFGNHVNMNGESLDKRGRVVNTERYVLNRKGEPVIEHQRDQQYTRELGERLQTIYFEQNTLLSTHILATVIFVMLRKRHPNMDLFRFLREARLDPEGLLIRDVEAAIGRLHDRLLVDAAEGKLRIDSRLRGLSPNSLMLNGIRHFNIYHTNPVVERRGDRLYVTDAKLLYYYRNRTRCYDFEEVIHG